MSGPRMFQAETVTGHRRSLGATLPQLLQRNAREFPDRIAIRSKRDGIWRPKTWSTIHDEVLRTARGLASIGLDRGDVLAIVSENREESFVGELAAIALGAISVSVFPDSTAQELGFILGHCGARYILCEDQEQVDKVLACPAEAQAMQAILYVEPRGLWDYDADRLIPLADLRRNGESHQSDSWIEARIEDAGPSDIAVYCYTSGTTGKPKGAMLSHGFILDNAYRLMTALDIAPNGNYLSYISPAWAAEQFMGIALPMLAPLVLHFAEKPETVQADLREIGPEFLMFTPRQWEMQASEVDARMMDAPDWQYSLYQWGLQKGREKAAGRDSLWRRAVVYPLADQLVLKGIRDWLGLTNTRAVLSGGSGLSAELFERFRAFGVPLGNLYGSSELGLISTHTSTCKSPETMGKLMPSDPDIAPPMRAWVDEKGQLRLHVLAFSGYLDDPEASRDLGTTEEGFATGDAVKIDANGELIFLDRLKDLRRLRGGQAYPPQFLENHLRASPLIRDVIVFGDEERDHVVALINVDAEICGRFAERAGLSYGTFPELSQLAPIRQEVAKAVERVNAIVDHGARIVSFANLPKELDADESELTRSRKLRRSAIQQKYAGIIEALYAGKPSVHSQIEVTYRDGRKGALNAEVVMNHLGDAK